MGMPYYSYRKRDGVVPYRSIVDAAEGFGSMQGNILSLRFCQSSRKIKKELVPVIGVSEIRL
jgi:hypothetical protein